MGGSALVVSHPRARKKARGWGTEDSFPVGADLSSFAAWGSSAPWRGALIVRPRHCGPTLAGAWRLRDHAMDQSLSMEARQGGATPNLLPVESGHLDQNCALTA